MDPVSKEDALWRLVDFFTRSGIAGIAQFGETSFNTLADKDVAAYFANRVNDSKAFERTTQVLIRLKDKVALHNSVIQNLKEVAAHNSGELPVSFETAKVRQGYLRLKAANKAKGVQFSEKNLEYLLFVFKTQEMWPEIIDICENFEKLTGSTSEAASQIKTHYLSDSLLKLPAGKDHYYELIQNAVFGGKPEVSAAYATAMTKAHLKDGAVDHALKFFESELGKLREVKQKREDFLVTLFDTVYGEVHAADAELTYEDFKQKYLEMILLSNSAYKESFAVEQLKRVLAEKDYEEIDTLFQLYIVQKHENAIISTLPAEYVANNGAGVTEEAQAILTGDQFAELQTLAERKAALKAKINERDYNLILQVQQVMKNQKINLLAELNETSADDLQQIFGVRSKDDIEGVLKRTAHLQEAAASLTDAHTATLQNFHATLDTNLSKTFRTNLDAFFSSKREVPDRNVEKSIDNVYNRRRSNPANDYANNKYELDQFNKYMLRDGVEQDENDPVNVLGTAHDETILDLKEQLLAAVNERKGKILNIALGIFNKVQDQ